MPKVLIGFGLNEDGQCGASVKKEKDVVFPQIIKFPYRVQIMEISGGSRHSLALSTEGFVYSWGWGLYGIIFLWFHSPLYC
jgi:alpha-tubulin suppressor-like RCC1 family protein